MLRIVYYAMGFIFNMQHECVPDKIGGRYRCLTEDEL